MIKQGVGGMLAGIIFIVGMFLDPITLRLIQFSIIITVEQVPGRKVKGKQTWVYA